MTGRDAMPANRIITFGCRLNTYESEVMRGHADAAGLAGAVIVNTCAVTAEAERQARQAIRRARREAPDARIIVTGCAAQIDPAAWAAMPEVDRVIGNLEKLEPQTFLPADTEPVRVNDIMAEIAAASVEQASGIEEVNTAVGQMDEMTQQNAALVEQAAAAAESLRSQTEGLQRQVSAFKLDENEEPMKAAPAPVRKEAPAAKPAKGPERKADSKSAKPKPGRKIDAPDHDDDGDWESF